MNKKVLSAILFSALFAGTGTFTSCIDNDEPAGIEELRGAKAELLRAKVAVEQANAAFTLAQAETEKAKAAKENALAEIEKANAEYQKLLNEAQATENEAAKAKLEAKLEEAKQTAEKAALEHQKAMIELQESLAEAQRSYELTLKQIEIAKALMSEEDKVTVAELEREVETKQLAVERAATALTTAENGLYEATLNLDVEGNAWVAIKELDLKYAQAELTTAKENLDRYVNYMENIETADWLAEIKEIDVELEAIEKEFDKLDVEETKVRNSEEFKAQVDLVKAAENALAKEQDTLNNLKLTEDLTHTYLYFGSKNKEVKIEKETPMMEAGETIAGADFLDAEENGKEYAGYIAALKEEIASYTTERKYWLDSLAVLGKEDAEKDAEDAEKVLKAWKDALSAYNNAYSKEGWDAEVKKATAAKTAFDKAMTTASEEEDAVKKYKAQVAAAEAYRKVLVAYYTAGAKMSMSFNSYALPTYSTTTGQQNGYTSKTVQAWLSDETNGADNLLVINEVVGSDYFVTVEDGSEDKITYDGTDYAHCTRAAIAKVSTAADIYTALVDASNTAFGDAQNYVDVGMVNLQNGYLHNEPTVEDVKYVFNKGANVGSYGLYLLTKDEETDYVANNYAAIIEDLEAALEYWTAELEEIIATVETAETDVETAETALETAKETFAAYEYSIAAKYNVAKADLNGKKRALQAIKNKLAQYVNGELENGNYAGLEEWLAAAIKDAEYNIVYAEESVAAAEADLKKAQDGKYTAAEELAAAEKALEEATAELEKAQAELAEALANLQTALEIMAAE